MAKKRDPFKQDFNSKNDEWDFGAFDSMDSNYDDIPVKQVKPKGRKPLEDAGAYVTPVLKGASNTAINTLKDTILRNMPKTKSLADDASGFINELDSVKRDLMSSISPMNNSLKQLGRAILPKMKGAMPGDLHKRLTEAAKEDSSNSSRTLSKEELRAQAINESVNKALRLQIEQSTAETAERRLDTVVDRKISEKRHATTSSILDKILKEEQYKTEFFKTTTVGYYTKSLEIGMRQVYLQQDILATTQIMAKVVEEGLKGLLHNTMLPDIQKQRMTESWKEITRGALINKVNSKFGSLASIGTKVLKNIGNKIKNTADNTSSAMDLASSGIEMSDSMDDLENISGNKKSGPSTLGKQGLELGGDILAKWLISKMNPKLAKQFNKKILKPLAKGPEALLDNATNRAYLKLKEMDRNREYGGIKNGLKNILLDAVDISGSEKTKVGNSFSKNPLSPTPFDIATRTSIVEVIPGYLAKILQQVTIANKGKAEELVYDDKTRDFVAASQYTQSKVDQLHKEKSVRTGASFASGIGSVSAGLRYGAADKESYSKDVATFKNVRKDIEALMRNHAVNELLFRPDIIREYAITANPEDKITDIGKTIYDFNKINYLQMAFTNIEKPVIVAKFLTKAMYGPDGSKNTEVIREFESSIDSLMSDSDYIDKLADITNSFGTSRFMKDHFDQKESKKAGGDFVIDKDKIIQDYKQDYNSRMYDKRLFAADNTLSKSLNSDGFAFTDITEMLPPNMGNFISGKISPDIMNKRRFEKKTYNNIDVSNLGFNYTDNDPKNYDTTQYGSTKNKGINTTSILGKIEVIKTSGEHVLLEPIVGIRNVLDNYIKTRTSETSKPDNAGQSNISSDRISGTLENINTNIGTMVEQLISMREEHKALSMAGMVSSAPGADPKKVQGILRTIGRMGGSAVGGTFRLAGKMTAGTMGASLGLANGILKASTAILPSLIVGSGSIIGGGLRGMGSLGGSMISANMSLLKMMTSGVGKTLGVGVRGLGKLFGKSWGKNRDASGKMSSYIKDIYTQNSDNPVIKARDFLDGVYTQTKDGSMKMIHSASDIAGAVFNKSGDMMLSAEEAAQGLYDRTGKQLDFSNLKETTKNLFSKGTSSIGKGLFSGTKKLLSNGFMLPGSLTNSMAKFGLKGLGWAGSKIGSMAGKLFGRKDNDDRVITKSFVNSRISNKLDTIAKYLRPKNTAGDTDGDGIREGSYLDFMKNKKERANKSKDKNVSPWMMKGANRGMMTTVSRNGDDEGGMLSDMISLFGGNLLLKKFNALKGKFVGKIFGMFKGLKGLLGKGLSGLLGVFFGKGAMSGVLSGAAGIAGKAAGMAGGLMAKGGSALIEGASGLFAATKVSKTGIGAAITTGAGKVMAILEKAKSFIPDKLLKFFKIDKIAPMLAKKMGPKVVASFAAKLLTGPFFALVGAGQMAIAAITGAKNAKEILQIPDESDLDISDRLRVSLASTICEGIFGGILDTKWFAEDILGVSTAKYLNLGAPQDSNSDPDKPGSTKADGEVAAKTAANTKMDDKTKNAINEAAKNNAEYLKTTGATTAGSSTQVTDRNGNSFNVTTGGSDTGGVAAAQVDSSGGTGLGDYVKKFESGGKGSTAIAYDKEGGTSYGTYQLSSRKGSLNEFIDFCKGEAPEVYRALKPIAHKANTGSNSGEFPDAWAKLASSGQINGKLEHKFYERNFYGRTLQMLKRSNPELATLIQGSRALQESLWSATIQHGQGGAANLFNNSYSRGMTPEQLLRKIYSERFTSKYFPSLAKSSPDMLNNMNKRRGPQELSVMLGLLKNEPGGGGISTDASAGGVGSPNSSGGTMGMAMQNHEDTMRKYGVGSSGSGGGSYGGGGESSSAPVPRGIRGGTIGGFSAGGSPDTTGSTGSETKDVQENISKLQNLGVPAKVSLGGGGYTSVSKVNPDLLSKFTSATEEFYSKGGKLSITSAFRSNEDQMSLSGTAGAAKAGRSPHQKGLAFDIGDINGGGVKGRGFGTGTVADQFEPFANKFGLYRPYRKANEEQHFELKRGAASLNSPEAKGLDGGMGDASETPADKTTLANADIVKPGVQGGSTVDTQRTSTNYGSTSVPIGGGAGSFTANTVKTAMSGNNASSYIPPQANMTSENMIQPLVTIMTTVSETLLKISQDTGYLPNLGNIIATNTSSNNSSTPNNTTDTTAQKPVAAQTATGGKQISRSGYAPIDVSVKQPVNRALMA